MTIGQRVKFQGTQFQVLKEFGANSPPISITGASQANPVVLTASGHGRSAGDVIYVSSVGGMIQLNDNAFILGSVPDSSHLSLLGVNGLNYDAYTSGGVFDYGTWSDFCEITNYSRTGGSKTQIPATSVCSEEEEFEVGLKGPGSIQLTYNYAPLKSSAQVALNAWESSGEMMAFKIILPKSHGTIVRLGFVQQTNEQGANNGIYTGTATILLTGPAYGPV